MEAINQKLKNKNPLIFYFLNLKKYDSKKK